MQFSAENKTVDDKPNRSSPMHNYTSRTICSRGWSHGSFLQPTNSTAVVGLLATAVEGEGILGLDGCGVCGRTGMGMASGPASWDLGVPLRTLARGVGVEVQASPSDLEPWPREVDLARSCRCASSQEPAVCDLARMIGMAQRPRNLAQASLWCGLLALPHHRKISHETQPSLVRGSPTAVGRAMRNIEPLVPRPCALLNLPHC